MLDLKNNQILVGTLLDTPASRAVFQRRFGKLLKHPMVPAARGLTLEQLLSFARLYLPKSVIQDTLEELCRLELKPGVPPHSAVGRRFFLCVVTGRGAERSCP